MIDVNKLTDEEIEALNEALVDEWERRHPTPEPPEATGSKWTTYKTLYIMNVRSEPSRSADVVRVIQSDSLVTVESDTVEDSDGLVWARLLDGNYIAIRYKQMQFLEVNQR